MGVLISPCRSVSSVVKAFDPPITNVINFSSDNGVTMSAWI